jgi:alkylation response protein AidB-like acyl-CoA dehydrogenase
MKILRRGTFDSLAISEAFAGSDVMGMKTTATKTEDGKHWIVNGTKKWITNGKIYSCLIEYLVLSSCTGTFADYFTVGCRTEVRDLSHVKKCRDAELRGFLVWVLRSPH